MQKSGFLRLLPDDPKVWLWKSNLGAGSGMPTAVARGLSEVAGCLQDQAEDLGDRRVELFRDFLFKVQR